MVYIGAGNGDLLAIDLADRQAALEVRDRRTCIGESSPAVGGGLVYIGDLAGVVHAVKTADGSQARGRSRPASEIKSSPVIAGERVVDRLVRHASLCARAATGKVAWKLKTEGQVHATPTVVNGIIYFGGCDERFRAVRLTDGAVLFQVTLDANTGSSAVVEGNRAYLGTFNNEVVAIDLAREEDRVALQGSGSRVPVLLVAGARRRQGVSSAAATRRSTRSTRRPARRRGRS